MRIILLVFFIWLHLIDCKAQISCGISNLNEVKIDYGPSSFGKARQEKIRIAIRPVIVHKSNGEQLFSEFDVGNLIQKANEYFEPINYEFFIASFGIKHIYDDKFYNLNIEDELKLRENLDVNNAINLYLVSTIQLPNKDILSGFTSLPSLNQAGNRIFLSYLDRNREDFQSLIEKVFPHELGHYFGLLHTFNNSASEFISERELVTRSVGANCAVAGDYVCDTPADPFERISSNSALDCENGIPENIVDAFGQQFSPSFGNIMSYQIRCGNFFSPQQYERMRAAGNIRFSSEANYTIIQKPDRNLTVQISGKKVFCEDETIEIEWKAFGYFLPNNKFEFEMSNSDGKEFKKIEPIIAGNKAFISVQKGWKEGRNYRFLVKSTNPSVESFISENIEIRKRGTYQLSLDKPVIEKGEIAHLQVSFTGSGPWSWELNSGVKIENSLSTTMNIPITPSDDISFSMINASGACGYLDPGNEVKLFVIKPRLYVDPTSNLSFCQNSEVSLDIIGLTSGSSAAYSVQLIGKSTFILNPIITENNIRFFLPQEICAGEPIGLKIQGTAGLGDFSDIYNLTILPRPNKPNVISPLEVCNNEKNLFLKADGTNLKWYENLSNDKALESILVNSNQEGIFSYYVSQSNAQGCESAKSKIDVRVKSPLVVSISGDEEIVIGESAELKLNVSGQGPVEITLNDNSKIFTENGVFFYSVKPNSSFTYTIIEAKNNCGLGQTIGKAEVKVQFPLGISNEPSDFAIFPNPSSSGFFNYQSTKPLAAIKAYGILGNEIKVEIQEDNFFVKGQNSKEIFLKVTFDDGSTSTKKAIVIQ